ncbi:MAG: PaaI family thioesterase [Actinomycetes bacterium]
MTSQRTALGGSAAPLDAALGLTRGPDDGDWAVLLLQPTDIAVGATDPVTYLHGGVLATCVDTAAWEALVRDHDGSWVVSDLRLDFLRLARREPHLVLAVVRKAGRRQAVADVEIRAQGDPARVVALGRATLTRTDAT